MVMGSVGSARARSEIRDRGGTVGRIIPSLPYSAPCHARDVQGRLQGLACGETGTCPQTDPYPRHDPIDSTLPTRGMIPHRRASAPATLRLAAGRDRLHVAEPAVPRE